MEIIRTISLLQAFLKKCRQKEGSIGFVPTMGALHEGHLSLLKKSIMDNDYTICSIYVNPTQFNDKKDLISYPRNIKSDIQKLKTINCQALFSPSDSEMYTSKDISIDYNFTDCLNILEGQKRPGHFLGVVTIVHKLFNLIQPDIAYFGEKDYQQLRIIQLFVTMYKLPVKIISCSTVRNSKGLALSSRNKKLTTEEKDVALNVFRSLHILKEAIACFKQKYSNHVLKSRDLMSLKKLAIKNILNNPLIKLDYFEIIETENFRFTDCIDYRKNYRALIAVYIGDTRLIDNISIN